MMKAGIEKKCFNTLPSAKSGRSGNCTVRGASETGLTGPGLVESSESEMAKINGTLNVFLVKHFYLFYEQIKVVVSLFSTRMKQK